jgi:rare lipoprotein A
LSASARSSFHPVRRLALLLPVLWLGAACATHRPPPPAPPPVSRGGGVEEGIASWYGGDDGFEGKPTASGEIYDGEHMTAAHRTLPLGSIVEVQNLDNGKEARVRINDRGPFVKGRIIDLSRRAASELGVTGPGTASVRLTLVKEGLPEPPSLSSPTGLWAVQVGSFADPGRAERQAERVRAGGKQVYLEPYQGLSRVKVGPFESRQIAQDTLAQLQSQGFEGIVVPSGR